MSIFNCNAPSRGGENIILATVAAVYRDGISLIFDGAASASKKHYKCNTAVKFSPGDRVKICKNSGTYIVEYVVGTPLI